MRSKLHHSKFCSGFTLLSLIVFVLSISSCGDEEEEDTVCTGKEDKTAYLIAIDGKDLPYMSIYIDSDNYSAVVGGETTLFGDGTWISTLENEIRVSGVSEYKEIERSGKWECDFLKVQLVNDQNQSAGILEVQDWFTNTRYYVTSETNTYTYEIR